MNCYVCLATTLKHSARKIWGETADPTHTRAQSSFVLPDFVRRMFEDGGQTIETIPLGDLAGK